MKNYLVIDLGNTRIKTGYFPHAHSPQYQIFTSVNEDIFGYFQSIFPDFVLISSTGTEPDEKKISSFFYQDQVLFLNHEMVNDISLAYSHPEHLGKDRLAALKGAKEKWPATAVCVADAGTCLTLDFLDADGKHLGGTISPGLEMRLESMHRFTARLPRAHVQDFSGLLGSSTLSCMASGALSGLISEIEMHYKMLKIKYSSGAKLILTGGDADYLAHHLNSPNFAAPHLVLDGLYFILKGLRY